MSETGKTGFITKVIGDKRQWRQYKARVRALPENYRITAEALERYFTYAGGLTDGNLIMKMLDDFVDLFEQAAADETPIRDIVGDDPVEFAEEFIRNYSRGQWINKERQRLIDTIDSVAGDAS